MAGQFPPKNIRSSVEVTIEQLGGRWTVSRAEITVGAEVPGIDNTTFQGIAEGTRTGCPVSRALGGVAVTVDATLKT